METCPECGARWQGTRTCTDDFHLLLGWELAYLVYDVHHLLVLCYHLQHPSLYSPQMLQRAPQMLVDFVEGGISPQQMRQRIAISVDSGVRAFKIKGTAQQHGAYARPIHWQRRMGDVVDGGLDAYVPNVQAWAALVLADLRATGQTP
jgi:hypothetical protein